MKKLFYGTATILLSMAFLFSSISALSEDPTANCENENCCQNNAMEFIPFSIETGGTGSSTLPGAKQNLEIPELPISIENGGTNSTNVAGARTNLDVYSKLEVDNALPVLPISISEGGTGATTISSALSNLGITQQFIGNLMYPVGSIYISISSTNPNSLFGGTWTAWGQGRVPLGMGSNGTTNYTTVGATGGSEKHYHGWRIGAHWYYGMMVGESTSSITGACDSVTPNETSGGTYRGWSKLGALPSLQCQVNNSAQTSTKTVTASGAHTYGYTFNASSMQPYVTCYMWRRTA